MGYTIRAESERGTPINEAVYDEHNHLARLIEGAAERPSFRIVPYIDRYGDTVLNRLQLEDFVKEWEELRHEIADQSVLDLMSAVRALAEQCLARPHCYLRFIGD